MFQKVLFSVVILFNCIGLLGALWVYEIVAFQQTAFSIFLVSREPDLSRDSLCAETVSLSG